MKAASIHDLKQELQNTPSSAITELCLRLARFKKENKELLTYLLFEAHDTHTYMESVKQEMAAQFADINKSNVYFVKKTLRKILRTVNKHIRYSGLPAVEIELLIYFCSSMKELAIAFDSNPVLSNIYLNQLKKINKAIGGLHEDLQYDYQREIDKL
jgi:membrane-anchored protein YejM (alkaline phosphatase superfamily)